MPTETVVKPRRRARAESPPPLRLRTIKQTEQHHPGLEGRMRDLVRRCDAGHPDYVWMREAIVRIGRSIYIDEIAFDLGLIEHTAAAPAPSRRRAA